MTFVEAIKSGFKNYVKFEGRASRSEFWWFQLFYFLVIIVFDIIAGIMGRDGMGAAFGLLGLIGLAFLLPLLGLTIRRLHDTDRSGWWIFISLVPLVGPILLIVWYCLPGTPGPNNYGTGPGDNIANIASRFE